MLQLSQNSFDYLIICIGNISTSLVHSTPLFCNALVHSVLLFYTIGMRQRLSFQLINVKYIIYLGSFWGFPKLKLKLKTKYFPTVYGLIFSNFIINVIASSALMYSPWNSANDITTLIVLIST